MPKESDSRQPMPQDQDPYMPYRGYVYSYQDNRYIAQIFSIPGMPQFRTSEQAEAFVRGTMRKQEEFMAHLDTLGIVYELNQEFLQGNGKIGFSYGDLTGGKAVTAWVLQTDPLAGDNSP